MFFTSFFQRFEILGPLNFRAKFVSWEFILEKIKIENFSSNDNQIHTAGIDSLKVAVKEYFVNNVND